MWWYWICDFSHFRFILHISRNAQNACLFNHQNDVIYSVFLFIYLMVYIYIHFVTLSLEDNDALY